MDLLTNFLLTAGILMCVFIIFALSKKLTHANHNRVLIGIFSVLLMATINLYSEINQLFWLYFISFPIVDVIGFLIGPLLLIYVQLLYQAQPFPFKTYYKHFLPLLIYFCLISIPSLYNIYTDNFLFSYQIFIQEYSFLLHLQGVYLLIYCVLALQQLHHFQQLTKQHYSDLSDKDVKWIRFLLLGLMITVSLDIVITIYELLDGTYFAEAEHVITLFMVSMILYLGYYGYLQSTILLPQYLFETTPTNNNTTVHTIEKHTTTEVIHHLSNASEDEIEALKQKLLDLLEKEKIHLDEDLTLGSLAKALSTTEKKLSALLNHYLNISFYDFINGYRVNAAIEKLTHQDYGHFTILAIAYDSGFKSKSSFNRIFKKTTGLSPSAYKKQHQ